MVNHEWLDNWRKGLEEAYLQEKMTMISTNTFSAIASAISILLYIACNTPVTPPGQSPQLPISRPVSESNLFSQAQVDSLQALSGKAIPSSLWRKLFEESPVEAQVFILPGNLDQDPEQELVLWYYWEAMRAMGELCLLDPKPNGWKKNGLQHLDFFGGMTPPSIDTASRMLLIYSYGTGSSYHSEVLNFYQNHHDSLVCVFKLLETETLCLLGSGALRSIQARYKCKDSSQIVATYRYQVNAGDNNRHMRKLLFKAQLSIPFFWDETRLQYLPKLPKDFPPMNSTEGYLDEGESTFDQFYAPQLQQLKWHGPRWKREALCNPYED